MSTRTYDLILLLDADAPTETRTRLITDAQQLINQHGDMKANKEWGNRQTPYRIDHHEEAEYHLFQFDTKPASISQIDRGFKLMEGVLRFRIFQSDGRELPVNPPTFKREERGYERPPANVAATPVLEETAVVPAPTPATPVVDGKESVSAEHGSEVPVAEDVESPATVISPPEIDVAVTAESTDPPTDESDVPEANTAEAPESQAVPEEPEPETEPATPETPA